MANNMFSKFKFLCNHFKNPITVALYNQRKIDSCILKFKNNLFEDFRVCEENDYLYRIFLYNYFTDNCRMSEIIDVMNQCISDKETFTFDGIVIKKDPTCSVFFEPDDYGDKISFKNRVVIDVGGNVADTALKFANWGGIEIHAFEAMPHLCKIAEENISLNPNLKDKIYFYNKAISSKNGTLTIYETEGSTVHSEYATEGIPREIEAVSIDYLLNELNIKPDVLKIDCEGCEYPIILESDLSMFNDIILEYHAFITKKPYTLLVDKLDEQGFTVDIYENIMGQIDDIGIIHAHK